ncbi:hypothetical protein DITRI_Ditri16bG0113000 [Diplodiscus trichospermus]
MINLTNFSVHGLSSSCSTSAAVATGEDIKPGPAPSSKASIEAIPRIKAKGTGNDCSICLEELKVDEEAREMPCKHFFHSGCVEKWLLIHGSCPVCRFLMPAEAVDSRGGDGGQGSLEVGSVQNPAQSGSSQGDNDPPAQGMD